MGIIAAAQGTSVNNASASTTLAIPVNYYTSLRPMWVAVGLASAAAYVTGITDTYSNVYSRISSAVNSSGVTIEIWWASSWTTSYSNTITVTASASVLMSAVAEQFSGVTGIGSTLTETGTGKIPYTTGVYTLQDSGNWPLCAVAWLSASGETATPWEGGSQIQIKVPSLTSVGILLMGGPSWLPGDVRNSCFLSASKAWAIAGVELRTGLALRTSSILALSTLPYIDLTLVLGGSGTPTVSHNSGAAFF